MAQCAQLYGLLEVPSNLMLKKFGASKWLAFIMFWCKLPVTFRFDLAQFSSQGEPS